MLPPTGFHSALEMGKTRENAVPYTEPPIETTEAITATASQGGANGVAAESHARQILTDEELARMDPDTRRETLKHRGVTEAKLLREEEVSAMDVATLRRMGLGRTPSGGSERPSST